MKDDERTFEEIKQVEAIYCRTQNLLTSLNEEWIWLDGKWFAPHH